MVTWHKLLLQSGSPIINYFNIMFINNDIHLQWRLPEFLPINYMIMFKCHRLCEPYFNEFSKEEMITSNSTIHIIKNISYGSHCIVSIIGNYGDDNTILVTKDVITSFLSKNDWFKFTLNYFYVVLIAPTLAPSTINITQLSSRYYCNLNLFTSPYYVLLLHT